MRERGRGSLLWSGVLSLAFCAGLQADSAQEVHDLFQTAAAALSDGKADAFEAAFDSSMPGFGKFRGNVVALLKASDAQSTVEWEKNEGDDQSRSVRLNWLLEITDRSNAGALTHRRARVECQVKKKGGAWRIASFTPADFFAPSQASDAWTVVMTAAMGLSEAATDASANSGDVPAANARKFMEAFDPAMSGYAQLRDNVLAMEQGADIESAVDLVQNEGDDAARALTLDWSINLVSHETSVTAVQRRETVTCRVEKQGKKWRITALEPRSLFAAPGAGKTPLY